MGQVVAALGAVNLDVVGSMVVSLGVVCSMVVNPAGVNTAGLAWWAVARERVVVLEAAVARDRIDRVGPWAAAVRMCPCQVLGVEVLAVEEVVVLRGARLRGFALWPDVRVRPAFSYGSPKAGIQA